MTKQKFLKWRIGVTLQTHHMVEIECETAQKAAEAAMEIAYRNPEYYKTGHSSTVSSIFINDSECSKFAQYVPEIRPGEYI